MSGVSVGARPNQSDLRVFTLCLACVMVPADGKSMLGTICGSYA
jgi:hypothetical protein